jgi:hypothetical protein
VGSDERRAILSGLQKAGASASKTASQSKLRKSLDAYGKELMGVEQIMSSAIKDLQAAHKSMHGLGMNMRRLAATPFGEDPQDFKHLYEEVVEQLTFVQRMLMSYRYVERVHDLGDEHDVLGTLGVADSFKDQQDMERYWGTDYDTSKSFRMAGLNDALRTFNNHYPHHKDLSFISDQAGPSGGRRKTYLGNGRDEIPGRRAGQLARVGLVDIFDAPSGAADGDKYVELTSKGQRSLRESDEAFGEL